jgi:hypothetical protein
VVSLLWDAVGIGRLATINSNGLLLLCVERPLWPYLLSFSATK